MEHSEGFLKLVEDAKSRITEIDAEGYGKLTAAGSNHILVDVREESEFDAGHAVGAIHLSKGVIERDVERTVPDKSVTLVLYCGGGYRSALAADNVQKMGYQKVLSFSGGWRSWKEAGFPVEK